MDIWRFCSGQEPMDIHGTKTLVTGPLERWAFGRVSVGKNQWMSNRFVIRTPWLLKNKSRQPTNFKAHNGKRGQNCRRKALDAFVSAFTVVDSSCSGFYHRSLQCRVSESKRERSGMISWKPKFQLDISVYMVKL